MGDEGPATQTARCSSTGGIAPVAADAAAMTTGNVCAVAPHLRALIPLPVRSGADMSSLLSLS